MAFKPQPNHSIYLDTLRRMSPQQRLTKALELSDNVRQLFRHGLRQRFPNLSEKDLQQLYSEETVFVSQQELLTKVVKELERLDVQYMLTGSLASSLQGEPRATHDIDLVVDLQPDIAKGLTHAFPQPDFYLSEKHVSESVRRKTMFNLVDVAAGGQG